MDVGAMETIYKSSTNIEKHYGGRFVLKLMFDKIILGKRLNWDEVPKIKFLSNKRFIQA